MRYIFIILLAISTNLLAQNNDCEKCFKKEKKSKAKSSIFSDSKLIQTKYVKLLNENSRDIYIQFKRTDKDFIVFRQQTVHNFAFKRSIVLGTAIKIALIFENGQNYIVTFQNNENVDFQGKDLDISSNETIIDENLSSLLKSNFISKIEILNPCNDTNQSKTIVGEISKSDSEVINKYYNCIILK